MSDDPKFSDAEKNYWAFQPVRKPAIPPVMNRAWTKSPIDAFILKELEARHMAPAAPADKITLIRRAAFDLTGLPPTPEEVAAFIADKSPKAFERVVDRLLASPHYGEKWARHWLDLARYADSDGFKADDTRPNIWRYRDYVIKSFNADKPYDRFVKEQLAGDELWPDDPDALAATGFSRHYPDEYNARNLMQRRQEILNDITDTTGAVFLGMTFACARCHDHKFDPILQKDYYKLQGFFAAVRAKDDYVLASKPEQAQYERQRINWEVQTKDLRERIAKLEAPVINSLYSDGFEKFPDDVKLAVNTAPEKRDTMQWLMYHKAQWQLNYGVDEDGNGIGQKLKGEQKKEWEALRKQLAAFDGIKPKPLPIGSGMTDVGRQAPATHTLKVGAYDVPLDEVQPGFLTILEKQPAQAVKLAPSNNPNTTGRRTALTVWLTRQDNPLTSRVMANRIWHYHFGRGIASTPSDFGLMGERPTNPALLDWLAATFVEQGWSIKKLHRLIMLSSSYQQSSAFNEEAAKVDPDNKLLWRFGRQRLTGEEIRDSVLAVSGQLNRQMFGSPVFPEIPEGLEIRGGWKKNESDEAKNRRSIYVFVRRNSRYPMFAAFDMPDTHESCARRSVTTTAPQALSLLNDKVILRAATAFAGRVLKECEADANAQIAAAYSLAFSRKPDAAEKQIALEFLQKQATIIKARIDQKQAVAQVPDLPASIDPSHAAAFVDLCHALLNSNEFVYIN
ncbi:MAG: DUF1549 and DUF1553 domain-containing protein [Acidobacteriota bacterium]|nr:DUF1549 and DUF1553 domain-containing protein [Acidobacteriota bacterium]